MRLHTDVQSNTTAAEQFIHLSPLRPSIDEVVDRAVRYLFDIQDPQGYWAGELEGDTILESEYIILMRFLKRGDESRLRKAAEYIKRKQMDNGGWAIFPNGPVDVSASVKAYFSLKLTGHSEDEAFMVRAREAIGQAGGVRAVNSYTRFYLAMLGQIPWSDAPAVPPELILLPKWFYFNIYEISSWSRTFVVPLGIIWAHKATTNIDHSMGIGELLSEQEREMIRLRIRPPVLSWRNFFLAMDRLAKTAERIRFVPLRKKAVKACEEWMLEHCENSAGLGAIFPPMVYTLIALRTMNYDDQHPQVIRAMYELEKLEIEESDTLRLQPCTSPVWDSAIALNALIEAGVDPEHPAVTKCTEWIVSKEVRDHGDWRVKRPNLEPSGWYFEFQNDFYPDIDDTAMVLMALEKVGDVPGKTEACRRGLSWVLGMQGKDGGWASFDVDNCKQIFNYIPFADHNAMLDPSTSDITARMLEMLSFYGFSESSRCTKQGIEFMRQEQELDGSWYGRWGVNFIYGTWQAIRGLTQIGVDAGDSMIQKGADWLARMQNPDGGWGEYCASYYCPGVKGCGESTASQTAWALMGLMCAGRANSPAVGAGIEYLTGTQTSEGTWNEEHWTGAGFPRVFYLKYHLYKHSFPLMALGMYRRLTGP